MPPVPRLTFREAERILLAHGFELTRVRGSHHRYRHPDGRATTLANHGKTIIPLKTMRSIIRQSQIDHWV